MSLATGFLEYISLVTDTIFKAILVKLLGHSKNIRHSRIHTKAVTQEKQVKRLRSKQEKKGFQTWTT